MNVSVPGAKASAIAEEVHNYLDSTELICGGVTVNGGAPGWGAWTQLTAACTNKLDALMIGVANCSGTRTLVLQIGIGAGGSEVPHSGCIMEYAEDLNDQQANTLLVGCNIPAGSRIAARVYAYVGAANLDVTVMGVYHA